MIKTKLTRQRFQGTWAQFTVLQHVAGLVTVFVSCVHGNGFGVSLFIVDGIGTHDYQFFFGSTRIHDHTDFFTFAAIGFFQAKKWKKKKKENFVSTENKNK